MIIRYPTGLYSSVLPRRPGDAGNVTWTISSTDPPRASLLFPKLPPGVQGRPRPPRVINLRDRQDSAGLLFTVNSVGRAATASATKQYEVGQVLEFGDPTPARQLDPYTAGSYSEIRHDTGLLDYRKLGFTAQQWAAVERRGDSAFGQLQQQLAATRRSYSDLQTAIVENQKLLSEADKALAALRAMGSGDQAIADMVRQLVRRRQELNSERGRLINSANDTARSADELLTQSRQLAQIVR